MILCNVVLTKKLFSNEEKIKRRSEKIFSAMLSLVTFCFKDFKIIQIIIKKLSVVITFEYFDLFIKKIFFTSFCKLK